MKICIYLIVAFSLLYFNSTWAHTHPLAHAAGRAIGITPSSIICEQEEIELQEKIFPSTIDFARAVQTATTLLVTDYRDTESPMALVIQDSFNELNIAPCEAVSLPVFKHAQAALQKELAKPTTQFILLNQKPQERFMNPEREETIADNWLFLVRIPSYSDHLFWIIVSRNDPKSAYVYGFN